MKIKWVIAGGILLFLFFLVLTQFLNQSTKHSPDKSVIVELKERLKTVGFTGEVSNRSNYSMFERGMFLIELKNVKICNRELIPTDCDFLFLKSNKLDFVAYSETVNRWDKYGLDIGYIVEKKVNSDTIVIYSSKDKPKYLFEIFDGIVNEWKPRELSNPLPVLNLTCPELSN